MSVVVTPFHNSSSEYREEQNPNTPLNKPTRSHTSPVAKLVSIRSVFVAVSLITVVILSVGLIIISIQGQNSIVDDLGLKIHVQLDNAIIGDLNGLFNWMTKQSKLSYVAFWNLTVPAREENVAVAFTPVIELMWSIVRWSSTGLEIEFDFDDGRLFGFDNFNNVGDYYNVEFVNPADENSLLYSYFWPQELNMSVLQNDYNKSKAIPEASFYLVPPYPIYPILRDKNRTQLIKCGDFYWEDVYFYGSAEENWQLVTLYQVICNQFGVRLGYLSLNVGISGIAALLEELTSEFDGKIFVMDQEHQLVASSTGTAIFNSSTANEFGNGGTRETVSTTAERWIKDVYNLLDKHTMGGAIRQVTVNDTEYLLSVTEWKKFDGIHWTIVKLLNYDQFLGNSQYYIKKSIITAVCVAIGAVTAVLLVVYFATKPLFQLARDLQKLSTLDFDYKPIETPRLFEVKKLHKAFVGMDAAMRSFSKFVPIQIVSNIIRSEVEVKAELKFTPLTVMFQDIEGFTRMSESMEPRLLASLTAEYMDLMTSIIVRHKGTIDKYIGDCIMSLFNAPEKLPNHPVAAVDAAVECIMALIQKNKEWKVKYGTEMACRLGINTGEALVGNMGSDNRMNYTAFGDSVNVAARLEGVNKYFGTRIIVSKSIMSVLPKGKFVSRKLGKVRVSGKSSATSIFEIKGDYTNSTPLLFQLYQNALKSFKNKDFTHALLTIQEALLMAPNDTPCLLLQDRIRETTKLSPLPDNWTYVEDLTKF